MVKLSVSTKNT